MTLDPNHVEWCRRHFALLADGGTWGLPSTGLIFIKRGKTLVLIERMPHVAAMPITAAELSEQQNHLYAMTVAHFKAAGIEVRCEVAT